MKILLITDIHHGRNTNYKHLKGEEYVNLFGEEFKESFLKLMDTMNRCDLVVNLGDLIHDEEREKDTAAYAEAVSFFNTSAKVEHALGNHDLRNLKIEDISGVIGRDKEYRSFDYKDFHHVILGGSRKEPRGPHYIEEDQLQWLEIDLESTNLPTLVYGHFPLDNQDFSENYYFKQRPDGGAMGNRGYVRQILEKSGKVKAVFNGHTHFFHQQTVKDIAYYTIPSFSENNGNHRPNHQFALVEASNEGIQFEIKNLN